MRALLTMLACVAVALGWTVAAPAATKHAAPKIVCFKKTVKGKRHQVCRPKRKAAPKRTSSTTPAVASPAPAPVAPTTPAPVTTSALLVPSAAPAPLAPAAPACVPQDTEWLTVTAQDALNGGYRFAFTRTCFKAGRVIVQYRNQDSQEHNLWVEGVSPGVARHAVVSAVPMGPGTMVQADANLSPGTWRFFCTIPGHEAMTKTVTVVP